MACSFAAAFGRFSLDAGIVPGLPRCPRAPASCAAADGEPRAVVSGVRRAGRVDSSLAFLAVRILSRAPPPCISLRFRASFSCPIVFLAAPTSELSFVQSGLLSFLVGFMTIAQFSFWGNYLPRVYPTYLRGTGESFAANIGGRMDWHVGWRCATTAASWRSLPGTASAREAGRARARFVGTAAYVIGVTASFWLPEPTRENLPD